MAAWTVALFVMGGACPANALLVHHPQKQLKQQVEDLESEWRNASLNGDIPAMDRLLSDDYVGISWTGEVSTKPMSLEHVRDRSMVITRMDRTDMKVKLLGRVAIVTALADVEGTSDGTEMKGLFRYTRVYQRLPTGSWKITNFEVTRVPDGEERGRHQRASSQ